MSSPRLKLEDLVVAYGQSTIIRGINLEVPENELVCLMGRNGVGKTTTLKTIVGLLRPESGVITMDGRQLDRLPTSERARSGIAYVPQGRDIFPGLTVWENLQTSIVVKGNSARAQVDRVFELFPALKGMLKRKGGVLSGGEQQQLAIGRALLLDPKLLILDEPTSGLDPNQILEIRNVIKTISKEKTVVFSTHIMQEVEAMANRVIMINEGRLVYDGSVDEIAEDGEPLDAAFRRLTTGKADG